MTVKEWFSIYEQAFPSTLSAPWDHDGIQCMTDPDRSVHRILCCLDVTDKTVDVAVNKNVDLIVSHHPLLFRPLYSVTDETMTARCLTRLCQNGIALFSFHTRADAADGGVSDLLAMQLGLTNVQAISTEDGSIPRIGDLPTPASLSALTSSVKRALGADAVFLSADDDERKVTRVAVSGGEGGDFLDIARRLGAEVYVTGNAGYHRALEAASGDMALIEAGHGNTERAIASLFADIAKKADKTVETTVFHAKGPVAF